MKINHANNNNDKKSMGKPKKHDILEVWLLMFIVHYCIAVFHVSATATELNKK